MKLFNFRKKAKTPLTENQSTVKTATIFTDFAKGISLDDSFEDMFEGEKPDEVRYYDIHGNEVKQQ